MLKYVLKRLLIMIPVLFCATFIVYMLFYMAPSNADRSAVRRAATPEEAQQIREERGLDDPIIVQYGREMKEIFSEDSNVRLQLSVRLPKTIKLSLTAALIALVLALPIGVFAAMRQNTLFDGVSMLISFFGVSMPNFWLGMLMMLLFSLYLGWFPTSGSTTLRSLVLPAFTLAFGNMAFISRMTRSSMLETIRQDYLTTARAKGQPYGMVIRKHALRNALIPITTVMGLRLCELFSGSILVELVFAWPGIGRLLVDSINERDYPWSWAASSPLPPVSPSSTWWWICCTSSSTPVSDNSSHTDLGIPNRSVSLRFFRTFFNLQPCQTPSFPYNKIIFSRKEF